MVDVLVWSMVFVTVGALLWIGIWYVKVLDGARRDVMEAFATMLNERDFRAKAEAELMLLRAEYQRLQSDLAKTVTRLEAVTGPTSVGEIRSIRTKKKRATSKLRMVTAGADREDPSAP